MDEYPDSDEEYELLHQEEMEAMKAMEVERVLNNIGSIPKSRSKLNFDSYSSEKSLENSRKDLQYNNHGGSKGKKRYLSSEALDIITSDLEVINQPSKKHKISDISNNVSCTNEFGTTSSKIPKWSFMPVVTDFGERLYVKINECTVEEDIPSSYIKNNSTILVTPISKLKTLAENLLKENTQFGDLESIPNNNEEEVLEGSNLWVEKYKPKTYFDLLSDEAVNRALLNWLKQWDKLVFNKNEYKANSIKNNFENGKGNFIKELDKDGRPFYKIALLCGPPGLGKTTLAHVAATLAGYNAVEVNASDDRTVEAFNSKLDAATKMQSVLGSCRPNCLILDEIDGAPTSSIEFLLKYLGNKNNENIKKGKKEKPNAIVKRPVICICNELYTPSLRQLRQQAFVVNFPQTSSIKLAQRLFEVCKKQNIKTDMSTLTLLCDKAQNDIRSCISTLHFFKNKNGERFKSSDVVKSNVGQKDVQKGVFNMWKELFQIPVKKKNLFCSTLNKTFEEEISSHVNYSKKGMDRLQYMVQMFQFSGDYDRLVQGVFENFLKSKFTGTFWSLVVGLEWFTWFDLLDFNVKRDQNFILMQYLPYSFAAWHFLFSSNSFWKISYPSAGYENHMKEVRRGQILSDVLRGLDAGTRSFNQKDGILLDVLPMFNVILTPQLRPVNPTLFNEREKKDFKQLLDVMIDYNLNFIQQRSSNGTYFYQFDPNIEELVIFDEASQTNGRSFSYNMKQVISHEVELERLRRAEEKQSINSLQNSERKNENLKLNLEKTNVLELSSSLPKKIQETEAQYKDFFGRIVKIKESSSVDRGISDKNNIVKSPIWFCFKEGYNNAVKKDITIGDIL